METVVSDLCEALARRVEIDVVVANKGWSTTRELSRGVRVLRLARWGEVLSTSIIPGLVAFLKEDRWDIIHIHHPNPMAAVAVLLARPHARLVLTYHSDIVRQRITGSLFGPVLARLLRRSDRIHVASRELEASSPILRSFHDRTSVIPFGIREERLLPLDGDARTEARAFGEWGAGRLILFVGRIVYYKGLEYLLRAMRLVDARLLVIGDGDLLKTSERLTARLGLEQRVRFLGEVPDATVSAAFAACDLFVLPSTARSEAFGLVLLEAMAFGKPIVSTALDTGVSYVNRDGETGIVVPPADVNALAEAIRKILGDDSLRARLGREARRRFESEFRIETAAERMFELYLSVMSK